MCVPPNMYSKTALLPKHVVLLYFPDVYCTGFELGRVRLGVCGRHNPPPSSSLAPTFPGFGAGVFKDVLELSPPESAVALDVSRWLRAVHDTLILQPRCGEV